MGQGGSGDLPGTTTSGGLPGATSSVGLSGTTTSGSLSGASTSGGQPNTSLFPIKLIFLRFIFHYEIKSVQSRKLL